MSCTPGPLVHLRHYVPLATLASQVCARYQIRIPPTPSKPSPKSLNASGSPRRQDTLTRQTILDWPARSRNTRPQIHSLCHLITSRLLFAITVTRILDLADIS